MDLMYKLSDNIISAEVKGQIFLSYIKVVNSKSIFFPLAGTKSHNSMDLIL